LYRICILIKYPKLPWTPQHWLARAGVPDERLGIARIGLEHFEAAVAGHVSDLEQVRATLHGAGDEAGAQAVAGKCRSLEAQLGGTGLHNGGDVGGAKTRRGDALIAPIEYATEDRTLGDARGDEPGFQGRDRAGDLAPRYSNLAPLALLVGFATADRALSPENTQISRLAAESRVARGFTCDRSR
jgi:hypothetical protein